MIDRIKSSGIVCSSNNIDNSYEAISCSRVVLFYRTTIGLEALAMDTKVLNLNYDKDMTPISQHDYCAVLTDPSYDKFESRLLYLLASNKSEFEDETKDLVYNYMNNTSNNNLLKDILNTVFQNYTHDAQTY